MPTGVGSREGQDRLYDSPELVLGLYVPLQSPGTVEQ